MPPVYFRFNFTEERLVRWTIMRPILTWKNLLSTFHSKSILFDFSLPVPLSLREYSECSKRWSDASSFVENWKRNTRFGAPPRSIPTLFHARKEIIAQFKNRRGCARFLYYAPCPSWQGWKITRPLSSTSTSPIRTRNENPPLQETAFHSLKTQHTRPGWFIFYSWDEQPVPFSFNFSRVVSLPPRFASPLFPNIATGCNVPRQ